MNEEITTYLHKDAKINLIDERTRAELPLRDVGSFRHFRHYINDETRRAASARLPASSHYGYRRNAIVGGEQWISIAIPGTFRSCDSGKIRGDGTLIKVMHRG